MAFSSFLDHSAPIPGTRWHELAFVLILTFVITWPMQRAGVDLWLADHLFRWQGNAWQARDAWWSSTLLHAGGRNLAILAWLTAGGVWIASRRRPRLTRWRAPLGYLLTSVALSSILLWLWKRASGVDCPWDLLRYGGTRIYLAPFSGESAGEPAGTCFPAAHAAVAYAWLALWFALAGVRPHWRLPALFGVLAIGVSFGFMQQLRGAHFLSHDIWSLALCWLVAATLARFWPWPAPRSGAIRTPSHTSALEPAR